MYDIYYNTVPVGKAEVKREGLYYNFSCSCTQSNTEIHRILVSDGNRSRDLGICVPAGKQFILRTKIPAKYFSGDRFTFTLVTHNADNQTKSIPVATDQPFEQLDKLETARLSTANGQLMIVID